MDVRSANDPVIASARCVRAGLWHHYMSRSRFRAFAPTPGPASFLDRVFRNQAIRRALESAGVEFIDENGGGPGVPLRKPPKQKR